ncbi:MAG: tetratricopeptide repeat protein [Treponema sp.]|jgi:tetratricopeptide (TPR) repeat protein|nr:tetratricopeptide repeat protein [Treponema sp.]
MESYEEINKYGNVTFGQTSKFLIDIIGQNVILDYISKNIENEKEAEKKREAFKQNLDRMYRGQAVYYKKFATAERESPQWYIEQFFKEILEKKEKYNLPRIVYIIIDSFTWQLFFALTWHTPFEKLKSETVLFHLRKQVFCFIYHNLLNGMPLSDGSVYKISSNSIIRFLSDDFKNIFLELGNKYKDNEDFMKPKTRGLELMLQKTFENKKTIHGKIENYYDDNADKYPRLDASDYSPNYRQNIHNWQNEKINPTWKALEPILDFLQKNNGIVFVHRLIGHCFLRNTQKALENVLHISQPEQEKIITDIKTMINDKRKPEEFYIENDFEFLEQVNLIYMCLVYQHQEDFDPVKSDAIINVIESKCTNSKKFFSPWLNARAKVFETGETIRNNKDLIIKGYKKAYDEGIAYAGCYLSQFLLEAIVINRFCRREGNNYYGYGYALELFESEKENLYKFIKESKNTEPCKGFIDIHYSCNLRGKQIPLRYPNIQYNIELENEAILINNKGLEYEKTGDLKSAVECFTGALLLNPVYVNAYSNRGNVYSKMGEQFTEYALADFNMAFLLEPKHGNTLFNRGWLLFKNGQFKNAITDLTKVIEINPKDSEAYLRRGICYRYMEYFNHAIEDYSKAIEINPRYAEAYYNRGVVYKLLGANDKAQEDCCKGKQIEPEIFLKNGIELFYPNLLK